MTMLYVPAVVKPEYVPSKRFPPAGHSSTVGEFVIGLCGDGGAKFGGRSTAHTREIVPLSFALPGSFGSVTLSAKIVAVLPEDKVFPPTTPTGPAMIGRNRLKLVPLPMTTLVTAVKSAASFV